MSDRTESGTFCIARTGPGLSSGSPGPFDSEHIQISPAAEARPNSYTKTNIERARKGEAYGAIPWGAGGICTLGFLGWRGVCLSLSCYCFTPLRPDRRGRS